MEEGKGEEDERRRKKGDMDECRISKIKTNIS